MYIKQGERKLKHKIIWFLADIKEFTERQLYIFEYFVKINGKYTTKIITILVEKNMLSGEVYSQKSKGQEALKILEREKIRLLYTSDDIKIKKGKPYGWVYGDNREIHNKKGEVVEIRRYRCDYYGQKERC